MTLVAACSSESFRLRVMRAFMAVALSDEVLSKCGRIRERLQRLDLDGRFVASQGLHLTMKFLGQIRVERLPTLSGALDEAARRSDPFFVEIRGAGVFPAKRNPRIVWVGVHPADQIIELQGRIEERCGRLGFPREDRPFHPHLTLLRLKSRRNVDRLVHYLRSEGPDESAGTLLVREIHLYQSILRPEGAVYRRLGTSPLGDRAG